MWSIRVKPEATQKITRMLRSILYGMTTTVSSLGFALAKRLAEWEGYPISLSISE